MNIKGFVWYRGIIDKILCKHNVARKEVEEVFAGNPGFKLIEKGRIKGEQEFGVKPFRAKINLKLWDCF